MDAAVELLCFVMRKARRDEDVTCVRRSPDGRRQGDFN